MATSQLEALKTFSVLNCGTCGCGMAEGDAPAGDESPVDSPVETVAPEGDSDTGSDKPSEE